MVISAIIRDTQTHTRLQMCITMVSVKHFVIFDNVLGNERRKQLTRKKALAGLNWSGRRML